MRLTTGLCFILFGTSYTLRNTSLSAQLDNIHCTARLCQALISVICSFFLFLPIYMISNLARRVFVLSCCLEECKASGPVVGSPALPWLRGKLLGETAGLFDWARREDSARWGSYLSRRPQRTKAKQTASDVCVWAGLNVKKCQKTVNSTYKYALNFS